MIASVKGDRTLKLWQLNKLQLQSLDLNPLFAS
jgi:hypothetical protein